MSHFNIVRTVETKKTFATEKVVGMFDLSDNNRTEHFTGDIDLPDDWNIGVIVGASGTGKTTIAKELFGDQYFVEPTFNDESILNNMPVKDVETIVKTFNAVGFSSPPSWLKPYGVLSNGEKMRVQLAYALLSNNDLNVFDEFTSVVDRNVAKIGSTAIAKSVRRANKQFIAVSCHYDILDWLEPDWVFDTNTMTMQKKNSKDHQLKLTSFGKKDSGTFFANITI